MGVRPWSVILHYYSFVASFTSFREVLIFFHQWETQCFWSWWTTKWHLSRDRHLHSSLPIPNQRPTPLSWYAWSLHNSGLTFNFAFTSEFSTQFHHLQHLSFDFYTPPTPPNPQKVVLHPVLNHWRQKLIVTQPNYSYPLINPNIFFQISPLGLNVYGSIGNKKLINPNIAIGLECLRKSPKHFFSFK